jgi:hypothetical protein
MIRMVTQTGTSGEEKVLSAENEIKEGHCYLVEETRYETSFEIFKEILSGGAQGVCFTREYPGTISEKFGLKDVPVFWLCYSVGDKKIHPKRLGVLGMEIMKFVRENQQGVILLDGLEYLIVNNDFNKVIKTIHSMCEVVMQNSSRLLIPVNPETLNERELALLERNLEVIKLRTAPEPKEE